jgi:putative ABC transport system permease protein
MFKNYIQVALRSLWRRRTFTFLNVMGLSVGIASALVLFLIIQFENSFDRFHTNRDRIYRVTTEYLGEGGGYSQGVPIVLGTVLQKEFPQVELSASTKGVYGALFTVPSTGSAQPKKFQQDLGILYTEPGLFRIFDFPWLSGNPASLGDPYTMAIEQDVAKKWFGDWKDAMGKTVIMDNLHPYRIVGIMTNHRDNTDIPLRVALSYASFPDKDNVNWGNVSSSQNLYVLFGARASLKDAKALVHSFSDHHFDNKNSHGQTYIDFQPLKSMHFDDRASTYYADWDGQIIGSKSLWALGLIGAFLLMIACVNFINLATAQSVSRGKEIGVRKVLGSTKGKLISQFLGETFLITLLALFLACIWAEIGTHFYLNNLLGKPLSVNMVDHPVIFVFLLVVAALVTLLAGFYPALVLSRFNPIKAIKSKATPQGSSGISLRRSLVIFQFAIAQMLVIGTLVVVKQINYFMSRPLGFDKDAILMVDIPRDSVSQTKFEYLKQTLLKEPGVVNASLCSTAPSSGWIWSGDFTYDNRPNPELFDLSFRMTDTSYFSTFHIKLVAGRLPYPSDTMREFMLSELTVHKMGIKDYNEVLGKNMRLGRHIFPIVGVVQDFHSQSLQNALNPLAFSTRKSYYGQIAVRLDPTQIQPTMKRIQADWEATFPEFLYKASFLDKDLATYYSSEEQTSSLFRIFSGIALIISFLGLYGLVSFMAAQREKEVGIRKVLGASVGNIVFLFSKEFTLLIALAFLISAPVGAYFMSRWLSNFSYKINLGWSAFAISIIGSLLVAWLTVGYKAIGAALANPIKALRSE